MGYYFYTYTNIPLWWKILLTGVLGLIVTFIFNEIIKRIPFVRYTVLGIRKEKHEI
jgi:hypothetical protein